MGFGPTTSGLQTHIAFPCKSNHAVLSLSLHSQMRPFHRHTLMLLFGLFQTHSALWRIFDLYWYFHAIWKITWTTFKVFSWVLISRELIFARIYSRNRDLRRGKLFSRISRFSYFSTFRENCLGYLIRLFSRISRWALFWKGFARTNFREFRECRPNRENKFSRKLVLVKISTFKVYEAVIIVRIVSMWYKIIIQHVGLEIIAFLC